MFLIVSELREQLGHCITVAQSLNTRCQSMLINARNKLNGYRSNA